MSVVSFATIQPLVSPEIFQKAQELSVGGVEPIDSTEILIEGAEALGTAIGLLTAGPQGAVLGGLIGKSLLGVVFGFGDLDGQNAFESEVISRLAAIERKVDAVLLFLQRDLPGIVRKEVSKAFAEQTALELGAKLTTVSGFVRMFDDAEGRLEQRDLESMREAGTESLEYGVALMRRGQDWYQAVIHAFSSGLAVYARILKGDPQYRHVLAAFAAKYAEYAEACLASKVPPAYWIDPTPAETLTMAAARVDAELADSSVRLAGVSSGRVSYLTAYSFQKSVVVPDESGGAPENRPSGVYYCAGWWEMVNGGTGFNGNRYATGAWLPIPGLTAHPTPQRVVDALNETPGHQRYALPPGFPVEAQTAWGMASYDAYVSFLWAALSTQQRNPAIRDSLGVAVPALRALSEGAKKIARA